jgi:hypothetical protein
MSAMLDRHGIEMPAPFRGHPFGGLVREDQSDETDALNDISVSRSDVDAILARDDSGGFDFHLGVYSRF